MPLSIVAWSVQEEIFLDLRDDVSHLTDRTEMLLQTIEVFGKDAKAFDPRTITQTSSDYSPSQLLVINVHYL